MLGDDSKKLFNALGRLRWRVPRAAIASVSANMPEERAENLPAPPPTVIETQRYFPLTPDMAITRLHDGHFVYVDPLDEAVGIHLITRGDWESWIRVVVQNLIQPGDHIIEVGANFGFYTIMMAHRVGPAGSLISFEGNPSLAELVRKSTRFNGYHDRVRVVAKAASDAGGMVGFIVSRRNAGGGALGSDSSSLGEDSQLISVPAVRLDDECLRDDVRLIRLDAEGSEPLILRGAERILRNPHIVVVLEWDVAQMTARADVPAFVDWLNGQGFRFWRIQYDSTLVETVAADMATLPACEIVMSRQPPPGGVILPC